MSVLSNGDPPNSIWERICTFSSPLSLIAELIKLGAEIKGLLILIAGTLLAIAWALHINVAELTEPVPQKVVTQPEYHAPFHMPGTQYDGKNDPIVSTPRFAEKLKMPTDNPKVLPPKPAVRVSNVEQPKQEPKMTIGLWLHKICPLIFQEPVEADHT